MYAWTITKDLGGWNVQGITGPADCDLTAAQIATDPKAERFRVRDADGELYYEGKALLDERCSGLEPLDDFGTPAMGAVTIEWFDRDIGGWRAL